jgi:hypothetical protein
MIIQCFPFFFVPLAILFLPFAECKTAFWYFCGIQEYLYNSRRNYEEK